jgi:hypothetical protein
MEILISASVVRHAAPFTEVVAKGSRGPCNLLDYHAVRFAQS